MDNWAQIAASVIAAVLALAAVVGFFRTNVSKSTIELYKQDNEALRARLKTLEETVAQGETRIVALEAQNHTLVGVVTQAAAIAHLQATIELIAAKVGVVI